MVKVIDLKLKVSDSCDQTSNRGIASTCEGLVVVREPAADPQLGNEADTEIKSLVIFTSFQTLSWFKRPTKN